TTTFIAIAAPTEGGRRQRRASARRRQQPAGAFPGTRRLAARGGRVGQVRRPVWPRQIGVDGKQPIGAPTDETKRLESPVADQTLEHDGLAQRAPLARLVVELHLPEEAELPFLDGLLGQP